MQTTERMRPVETGVGAAAWKSLYLAGGWAALLAGVIFRRNIGAEVSLFTATSIPQSAAGWFALLHSRPLVGLAFLEVFDLLDYALAGLMFLALGVALWQRHRSAVLVAAASGLVAIAASFASNGTFAMLSLSQQYASAATPAEQAALLTAGQTVLALNDTSATFQGTGYYTSLLLLAVAGMIFSIAMLRDPIFNRAAAWLGILAAACDLLYCATFTLLPFLKIPLMSAGGLFLMIWHILVGLRLVQLGRGALQAKRDVHPASKGE